MTVATVIALTHWNFLLPLFRFWFLNFQTFFCILRPVEEDISFHLIVKLAHPFCVVTLSSESIISLKIIIIIITSCGCVQSPRLAVVISLRFILGLSLLFCLVAPKFIYRLQYTKWFYSINKVGFVIFRRMDFLICWYVPSVFSIAVYTNKILMSWGFSFRSRRRSRRRKVRCRFIAESGWTLRRSLPRWEPET